MIKDNTKNNSITEKRIERYVNAVYQFGKHYYGSDKQVDRDLEFMNKKYEKHGGWEKGKKTAMKELFKRIFK